jgi:tetratricopeptide (TPR) repeat protein
MQTPTKIETILHMQTSRPPLRSAILTVVAACLAIALMGGCTPAARRARTSERADRYFKAGDYDKARTEYLNVLRLDSTNRTAIRQLGIIWLEEGAPLRALPFLNTARDLDPNDLNIRIKFAFARLFLGGTEQARKEALAILQQSPSEDEALIVLGNSILSREQADDTQEQLRQIKPPDSANLHLTLANLALRKGDVSTAENELQRALTADPKSAIAHMAMGNFLFSRKEMDRAGQEFKTAAELAPARSLLRMRYAEFQANRGAPNDARATLKEVTRQAPDYLPAWVLFARLAFSEKKYDESLSLLENVISRDPQNIDARTLEAQALLAKGETKKAIQVMEALDKTYPNAPGIEYYLALAYLQDNNSSQAIAELKKAVAHNPNYVEPILVLAKLNLQNNKPQDVISAMIELLRKQPSSTAAQGLLVEAYRSVGRLDDAIAVLRQEIASMPQNAQGYYLLGVVLRQQGKTDEARQAFEKTLQLAPDNRLPIDQLVGLDIDNNDFKTPMQRVQSAFQKTPNSASLYVIESKVYIAQREWDQAEAALLKALTLDPNSSPAYDLLISTYLGANKVPQALNQVQTALAKRPDNPQLLMTLGQIYEKQNEPLKARDVYEKLLVKNPDFVPAVNNLAYLYAEKLNDVDKAYKLARKARDLRSDPSIADTLGWVLYKKGDYQQAQTLFQDSAGKLPQDSAVQFHLGMASYMMGQADTARAAFQQALKGTANFEGKDEAQRRLGLLDALSSATLSSEQLESMLKQQSNDPLARLRLAESYEKQNAFAKAAAEYESALKINPKLLTPLIKLAQLNAGPLHNNQKALEFAKKAREFAPNDPKVVGLLGHVAYVLGHAAYHAGNFTWAYSLLQESARYLTDDPTVLYDCGLAAYSLGKVSEARELMERTLKAAPAPEISGDAQSFLRMTALDRNPKEAVTHEIQKLLKADPNYVPALAVRAAIEEQRGEARTAIATYTAILKIYPHFAPAQKRLAALYLDDPTALDTAYEFAVKARQALPDDPELARILGEISYQRKDYSRALQLLRESARATPLDAKGSYYLGASQLQLNQKPQATEALERALSAGLQEPFASDAKRLLAEAKTQ